MTTTAPPAVPETITLPEVDRWDGTRVYDAVLTVQRVVRLNCGCDRIECDRPGGGTGVHVLRGAHCEAQAVPV